MIWISRPPVDLSDAPTVLTDFVGTAEGQGGENGTVYYNDGRGDRRVLTTDHLCAMYTRLLQGEDALRLARTALEDGRAMTFLPAIRAVLRPVPQDLRVVRVWMVPAVQTVDRYQAKVWAIFEDGPDGPLETQMLFRFHEQEISFTGEEFLGLTRRTAKSRGGGPPEPEDGRDGEHPGGARPFRNWWCSG